MPLMVVCGLLVVLGVLAVVRWGGADVTVPPPERQDPAEPPPPGLVARRYLRYVALAVGSGVGSGILVAGAGGRLAMRLMAATSSDAAQGRLTEADEVVGRITTGGTIGFILFVALFFGFASGVLYLLLRRWLPRGRAGGLAYGVLLLAIAATRLDPLRAENPDFDIVGPGWVAVVVFGALVILHGMVVAALAGGYSRVLPLPSLDRRSLVAHAPLVILLPAAPVFLIIAFVGAIAVVLSRFETVAFLRSSRALVIGRGVLVAAGLLALPGCVSAVVDIAGRHP